MTRELFEFLETFLPIPPHHMEPKSPSKPWVFWSQNFSSSDDLGTPINMIHKKIKSAFFETADCQMFLGQFWAPVTIGGRRVLSTSGQPFAVSYLSNDFARYRVYSEMYKYNIDANKLDTEGDHMIMSGGPANAFLSCLPYMNHLEWLPSDDSTPLNFSIMLPICLPSQTHCIGVLEFTLDLWIHYLEHFVLYMIRKLKKVGLDVFCVEKLVPYKTLNDLKPAKDKIEEALKIICGSHNLALAQVWITYENKNHMPCSSSLDDTRMKRLLALKLTGYLCPVTKLDTNDFERYYSLCDVIPHGVIPHRVEEEVVLKTLQDYKSRHISKLCSNILVDWDRQCSDVNGLTICLRSIETGDFDYAFEFIWIKHADYVIFLEAILLSLKRCLPGFKFAFGAELGDELDVIHVQISTNNEAVETGEKLKIFQGKKSMVADYVASSEVKCYKTTPEVISRQVIEKQFGKTMKEAAKNLHVSKSTLKRKLRKHGIPEWPLARTKFYEEKRI